MSFPSSSSLSGLLNYAGANGGVGEPETFWGTHLRDRDLKDGRPEGVDQD